jgi:nucleoside-diphosphate-sugar epimerase
VRAGLGGRYARSRGGATGTKRRDASAPLTLVPARTLPDSTRPGRGENLAALRSIASRSIQGADVESFGCWDRVVVTGGTGCIGSVVVALLKEAGVPQVISIADRGPVRYGPVAGVQYELGDITDKGHMESLLAAIQPDLVVHLAGIRDPALAEQRILDVVRTNVVGTENVLQASAAAGVSVAITASTGKAMRPFTSAVYASSKQLVEYETARAASYAGMKTGCARFTHVVDNSLIYDKLRTWAASGRPVTLHGPDVDLYVQSAREAAELLLLTARVVYENPGASWLMAIRDLGWPPIDLLGLAMDVVEEAHSSSPIVSVGFSPGYEERPYEGTVDPLTAGDHSPLFNALEAIRSFTPLWFPDSVDGCLQLGTSSALDELLSSLGAAASTCGPEAVKERMLHACMAYLRLKLDMAPLHVVSTMHRRGELSGLLSHDHRVVHDLLSSHLDAMRPASPSLVGQST